MENVESYTDVQFEEALEETLKKMLVNGAVLPSEEPMAVLLGGQSGAGKSTLHRIIRAYYDSNVIVINGDEYRKSHPRFNEIQQQYGQDAPAHTARWSGAMTEALIDAFSNEGYNLVIEGTLRTSEVPLNTARLLRERGYGISLAIMAVKPDISLVSCQIRYEMMRIAGTTSHATNPKHHNMIAHDIVENLATLEASDMFDEIYIHNRAAVRLFPTEDEPHSASEVLREAIFGAWTAEEEVHYEHLKQQLEELREQ